MLINNQTIIELFIRLLHLSLILIINFKLIIMLFNMFDMLLIFFI